MNSVTLLKFSFFFISDQLFNFNKYPRSTIDSLGTPYDYDSIMHYAPKEFSRNNRYTIQPRRQGVRIGNRSYLSRIDIKQVNMMYRCNGGGGGNPAPPPPGKKNKTDTHKASCQWYGSFHNLFDWQSVCRSSCFDCLYPELFPSFKLYYISDNAITTKDLKSFKTKTLIPQVVVF